MKAMVLAAGLGTRLGEITQRMPKCLVEVRGKTLLAHTIDRLKAVGVDSVVINTHHFADQVARYVAAQNNFGISVHLSHEVELLDTGGGIYHARDHFMGEREFLVQNADIFHFLDLNKLIAHHRERSPLATLMVMSRQSSRYLVFDSDSHLVGRVVGGEEPQLVRDAAVQNLYAFSGIHVISPAIFSYCSALGEKFSIIDAYLETVRHGATVMAHLVEEGDWSDVGTPERLAAVNVTS